MRKTPECLTSGVKGVADLPHLPDGVSGFSAESATRSEAVHLFWGHFGYGKDDTDVVPCQRVSGASVISTPPELGRLPEQGPRRPALPWICHRQQRVDDRTAADQVSSASSEARTSSTPIRPSKMREAWRRASSPRPPPVARRCRQQRPSPSPPRCSGRSSTPPTRLGGPPAANCARSRRAARSEKLPIESADRPRPAQDNRSTARPDHPPVNVGDRPSFDTHTTGVSLAGVGWALAVSIGIADDNGVPALCRTTPIPDSSGNAAGTETSRPG